MISIVMHVECTVNLIHFDSETEGVHILRPSVDQ